jgi:hypothetical protein
MVDIPTCSILYTLTIVSVVEQKLLAYVSEQKSDPALFQDADIKYRSPADQLTIANNGSRWLLKL